MLDITAVLIFECVALFVGISGVKERLQSACVCPLLSSHPNTVWCICCGVSTSFHPTLHYITSFHPTLSLAVT